MKSLTTLTHFFSAQRIGRYVLISALLTGVGCVSQQSYDKTRAEADELTRALDAARSDIQELDQRVAALQAMNKKEDAVTAELRATIQREQESGPILRQRADEKLAALQTQVAYLVNQNRLLGREMADAKQEGASLQALITQYRKEMEESRSLPLPMDSAQNAQATVQPPLTPVVPTTAPINSAAPSRQVAQSNPAAPSKQAVATRQAKGEPAQADESWTGMIKNWVSSLWNWIFQ